MFVKYPEHATPGVGRVASGKIDADKYGLAYHLVSVVFRSFPEELAKPIREAKIYLQENRTICH